MSTEPKRLSAAAVAFLQQQRAGRLATSDAEGHPTLVPVCYAFDGQRFFIALDEKPKSVDVHRLKRVRNIAARHEAALLVDQYSDDWSHLGYVLIHGHAELISAEDPLHAPALRLLRERYAQYRDMHLEIMPMIVITPQRVSEWGPALVGGES
jgi:PPOX class probable F420-dependent enzyme